MVHCPWNAYIAIVTMVTVQAFYLFSLFRNIYFSRWVCGRVENSIYYQQTRDVDPMLGQCWVSVVDGGSGYGRGP